MDKFSLLFIDDEKDFLGRLEKIFTNDDRLRLFFAESAENGLATTEKNDIDIIVSDQNMPSMKGIELFNITKNRFPDTMRILLTGYSDINETIRAINECQIFRYVRKPCEVFEIKEAVDSALQFIALRNENRKMTEQLEFYNRELESKVVRRTKEIKDVQQITIFSLARLAESRDPETGLHLQRIREYCRFTAKVMSEKGLHEDIVNDKFIDDLYQSSPLHDIGKVGIPDHILLKPSRLSPEEFEIMKKHSRIGGKTLEDAENELAKISSVISSVESFLAMGKEIAYYHHEKWNGAGYPEGLAGEKIPLCARITALADVYDAMTSTRPYKEAFTHEKTSEIIIKEREKHFDPNIIDIFMQKNDEYKNIAMKYKDSF